MSATVVHRYANGMVLQHSNQLQTWELGSQAEIWDGTKISAAIASWSAATDNHCCGVCRTGHFVINSRSALANEELVNTLADALQRYTQVIHSQWRKGMFFGTLHTSGGGVAGKGHETYSYLYPEWYSAFIKAGWKPTTKTVNPNTGNGIVSFQTLTGTHGDFL